MRITNKIIQNNSLTNINSNKVLQDKLSNMISTEKKINRPSDDPIIALRSLRLRTSVNQTDQYRSKNVEDGKSWLTVTEDAIGTLSEIITDVRKQYVKGASDTLAVSDRRIIHENLDALSKEIFNTGNADFAGRYVFTGYRTDTTLTFQKQEDTKFEIVETGKTYTHDSIQFVHKDPDDETLVTDNTINRIRLSYDKLESTTGVTLKVKTQPDPDPDNPLPLTNVPVVTRSISGTVSPYDYVLNNPSRAVFVPETGEILLGENVKVDGKELTPENILDSEVTYVKDEWVKGELRPQHYFKCTDITDPADPIKYNHESSPDGEICYNIGVNQSLRINTTAGECFDHSIVRELQDVIRAITDVEDIEAEITQLEADYAKIPETDTVAQKAQQNKIDAARKAQTFLNEKLHSLFSKGIGFADGHLAKNSLALTNCGTRSKRLELIENRLDTQLSTLKELKSENEDADMAETAIRLSSAKYAYDASLMATSKSIQQTLLNYL